MSEEVDKLVTALAAEGELPASERLPLHREPLLHFLVAGALLFGLHHAFGEPEPKPRARAQAPSKRIVLSESHRAELRQQWQQRSGHRLSEADIEQMVRQWIDREILYREAIAMGLHEHDEVVRNQVISKLTIAYQSLAPIPEPGDDQLRAYLDEHRERYTQAERYDIVHVFAPSDKPEAEAEIRAHLDAIEAGADPLTLGPRFAKGRRFRLRTEAKLASIFDESFAASVAAAEPGTWIVLESRHGWHGLRVTKVHPPSPPQLSELRERLRADWDREQRQSEVRRQVRRLREDYEVELPDGTVLRASELSQSKVETEL